MKKFQDLLIGEEVKIIYNNKEICGIIVDETKNTIILKVGNKKKILLKRSLIIKFQNKLENKNKMFEAKKIQDNIIEGKNLIKRPEERIK